MDWWPVMRTRVFFDSKHAAGSCLGTIQARTHVQLALACQQSLLKVQHMLVLPCNMCTFIQGSWELNVQIMLLRLAPLVWCQVLTSLHVGHIILLIPSQFLLPAATVVISWRNCVTSEQRWFRLSSTKTRVSALFLIGFSFVRTHTLHRM